MLLLLLKRRRSNGNYLRVLCAIAGGVSVDDLNIQCNTGVLFAVDSSNAIITDFAHPFDYDKNRWGTESPVRDMRVSSGPVPARKNLSEEMCFRNPKYSLFNTITKAFSLREMLVFFMQTTSDQNRFLALFNDKVKLFFIVCCVGSAFFICPQLKTESYFF